MKNSLEDILRNKLDKAEINPPADVFDQIKNTLNNNPKVNGSPKKKMLMNWAIGMAILIPAAVFTIWSLSRETESNLKIESPSNTKQEILTSTPLTPKAIEHNQIPPTDSPKSIINQSNELKTSAGSDQEVCGKKARLAARFSNSMSVGRWMAESKSVSFISDSMENPEEDPNATVVVNEYGVYKLKWIEKSTAQTAFDEVSIRFKEVPQTNLRDEEVCGLEIQLNSGGKRGEWSSPDNLIITSPNSAQSTIRSIKAGSYDLVWTENLEGCKSTDTITLKFSNMPVAEISLLNQEKCSAQVTVSSSKQSENKYFWDFGKGQASSVSDNKYSVKWTDAGVHTISLKVENAAGCFSEASLEVNIPELPAAFFQTEQIDQSAPALVYFNRQFSSPANPSKQWNYLWEFGDGKSSTLADPEHIYRQPGKYSVKLTVSDQNGCSSVYSNQSIEVKSESIYPRTVYFTPNGDNINDFFEVSETKLDQFTCLILNQKGEKIVELNQFNTRWDGQLKSGNPAAEGLYYFIIRGISSNGQKTEQNGMIYLLRE